MIIKLWKILIWFIPYGFVILLKLLNRKFRNYIFNSILKYRLNDYSKINKLKKLHLGCGEAILDGWFNTDRTNSKYVSFLDVKNIFPIKSNYFDYVFTEHLIEHLDYGEGCHLIKESFRVLKPGGKIRIATPNVKYLINLYDKERTNIEQMEIQRIVQKYFPNVNIYDELFVINNFFYNWGHKFIYDCQILTESMLSIGFININENLVSESNDVNLRKLEHHGLIIGEDINKLQTFVLEGSKPD
tara:strand:+ start:375 stop:1106 length:732 start_codon:yes stop_codon:yes gene_type:complete